MIDHEHYMHIALEEAERGAAEGNAAVGSILVSCLLYTSPSPRD